MANTQIHFSKYELWFLLSQVAPVTIVGFRNPMLGKLTEDIFPLVQEASFSLLDKGLIYADVNNSIKIRGDLEPLIHALTAPKHTHLIAFRLDNDQKEKTRSFNFEEKYTVVLEEQADGSYMLRQIDSKDELLFLVSEPFSDRVFWAPDTEPLYIPQEEITLVQQSVEASKMKEAKAHLETVAGDEQTKIHFLETLQNPKVRYTYISFMDRNNPDKNSVDGFSVIAGEHYIWILEIVDETEKLVRISKITLKDLNKKYNSIIPFS